LIQYAYGSGSFQPPHDLAKEAGATVKVFHSDRLALDIDMPADLEAYYASPGMGRRCRSPRRDDLKDIMSDE